MYAIILNPWVLLLVYIVIWGLLNFTTKLKPEKIVALASAAIPGTILIGSFINDVISHDLFFTWYIIWLLISVISYLSAPPIFRYYQNQSRQIQRKWGKWK